MKNMVKKIIFLDRVVFVMLSVVLLLAIFTITSFIYASRGERKNMALKTQLSEMLLLKDDILKIKDIVQSQERKIGLVKLTGAVSELEQTLKSIGLKAKVIKPLGIKKTEGFIEEDVELIIEGVDLNKIVNLLYKIEHSHLPLRIKTVEMKTTFENPNLFILSLTASLINKA